MNTTMQLCGCLMLLLAVASVHAGLTEGQMNHFSRVRSLVYKGKRLRCYQQGHTRIAEPYVAIKVPSRASVRRETIGDGFYFRLPLRIDKSMRLPKTIHLLRVRRFKVQLRQKSCRNECAKVRVMAEWSKATAMVRFSCDSRKDCQRVLRALRFKGARNDDLRRSLRFTFFGEAHGLHYELSRVGLPVANAIARPFAKEFWFESNKLVLFTIKSNIGLSALDTFNSDQDYAIPRDGSLPLVYRSHLLDQLATVAKTGSWEIVAEMRKAGHTVAQAVFNGNPSGLNRDSWFSAARLVSTKPYWIGRSGFNYFSVAGDTTYGGRIFFINRSYGRCKKDLGFWVVSDKRDGCLWAHKGFKGKTPTLIYTRFQNVPYQSGNADTADNFLVYMRLARPAVQTSAPALPSAFNFEKNKILLFTVKAQSNHAASATFLNSAIRHKVPRDGKLPIIFRSELIDKLSTMYRAAGKHYIVAEMRAGNRMVAKVVFDISSRRSELNKENWFSKDRVVSSYPYPLGSKFNYFSLRGHYGATWNRAFFISFQYAGCKGDRAFWAILDVKDGCPWGSRGWRHKPLLVYTTRGDRPMQSAGVAKYDADRFLVYLE